MVKQVFRGVFSGILRIGGGQLLRAAWRVGQRSALDTALGVAANAVPGTAERVHTQVFNVSPPTTVYLRASHCRVAVRHAAASTPTPKVTLEAKLQRVMGMEFAAEQDDAGVYIVLRRKPVVGTVSRADITLTVPPNTHLAFHLTPGEVVFENVNGIAKLSTEQVYTPASLTSTEPELRNR